MTPRIIVLSGSSKGLVIPIGDGSVSIGRDSSNALCLAGRPFPADTAGLTAPTAHMNSSISIVITALS